MIQKSPDWEKIHEASISGNENLIKAICRFLVRFDLHAGLAKVWEQEKEIADLRADHEKAAQWADETIDVIKVRIADLRETLGGVEAQVHELRNGKVPRPSIVALQRQSYEWERRALAAERALQTIRGEVDAYHADLDMADEGAM